MGSGSICTTIIQTGVGAPTFFATAEVADAIKDYNPKISLIADGGFQESGRFHQSLLCWCRYDYVWPFLCGLYRIARLYGYN